MYKTLTAIALALTTTHAVQLTPREQETLFDILNTDGYAGLTEKDIANIDPEAVYSAIYDLVEPEVGIDHYYGFSRDDFVLPYVLKSK